MKTTLKKTAIYYNPMQIDGTGKEVNHIVFYSHTTGKPILKNIPGGTFCDSVRWFSDSGSNNSYNEITFNFETVRKTKIDLSSKKAFYVKYHSEFRNEKNRVILFIPIESLNNFKCEGRRLKYKTGIEENYITEYSFIVEGEKEIMYLDENKEPQYKNVQGTHKITFSGYYETVKTKKGKEVDKIVNAINNLGVNISKYDIEKILDVADIKLKD